MQVHMHQLLLPLLLLSAAALVGCQLDSSHVESEGVGGGIPDVGRERPAVGDFFSARVTKTRIQKLTVAFSLRVTMFCGATSDGFYAWVKDLKVVGDRRALQVNSNSSRSVHGVYTCVRQIGGNFYGMDFVLTEMPGDEASVLSVRERHNPKLMCRVASSTGRYNWFRYNEEKFAFEPISGATGNELQLQYSDLSNKDRGFTFYKCQPDAPDARATSYEAFKLVKEPKEELIDGKMTKVYQIRARQIPADVGAVPVSVTPKSKVTFECEKVQSSDTARWYFRSNETSSLSNYTEVSGGGTVDVRDDRRSSILSLNNCDVRNKGYYRCDVGGVIRYAFLDIQGIVPTIHEYSKDVYDMSSKPGEENELECEIPLGGEVSDVVWRVVPTSGAPIDIRVNQVSSGFRTLVMESGVNQLATITFNDDATLNGYRLECRLGDEFDFVQLRSRPTSKIAVSVSDSEYPNYKYVSCDFTAEFSSIMFHVNDRKEDPVAAGIDPHGAPNSTHNNYYYNVASPGQKWFRCSGTKAGNRVYSEPKPLVENPREGAEIRVLQVVADSQMSQGTQLTQVECKISSPRLQLMQAEEVQLEFEGRLLEQRPVRNGAEFRFDIGDRLQAGSYRCRLPAAGVASAPAAVSRCTGERLCEAAPTTDLP